MKYSACIFHKQVSRQDYLYMCLQTLHVEGSDLGGLTLLVSQDPKGDQAVLTDACLSFLNGGDGLKHLVML